ncbi:MAG TPA: phosphatase PAP2 family protein [Oculatellaceae cyanobacterium]
MPTIVQNFDLLISNAFRSLQCVPLDLAAHLLTAVTYGGALWALLAVWLWRRGQRLLAVQIGLALIIALCETSVLKHFFHRERPTTIELYQLWMPLHNIFADKYSFPSGHTSQSFAAAGAIFMRYSDWRGRLALAFALLIGFCRIYEGMHWPSDVVVGIVIGLLASWIAVQCSRIESFRRRLKNRC